MVIYICRDFIRLCSAALRCPFQTSLFHVGTNAFSVLYPERVVPSQPSLNPSLCLCGGPITSNLSFGMIANRTSSFLSQSTLHSFKFFFGISVLEARSPPEPLSLEPFAGGVAPSLLFCLAPVLRKTTKVLSAGGKREDS